MSELKLFRIYVERKFLLPLRLVLFLAALWFLIDIYDAFFTNMVSSGRFTEVREEDPVGFYLIILKKTIFVSVLVWAATGGLKEKSS